MLILAAVAGAVAQQQEPENGSLGGSDNFEYKPSDNVGSTDKTTATLFVTTPPVGLYILLADDGDKDHSGGFSKIAVQYNGKTIEFSAQEIWDAIS